MHGNCRWPGRDLGLGLGECKAHNKMFFLEQIHTKIFEISQINSNGLSLNYRDKSKRFRLCQDNYEENFHIIVEIFLILSCAINMNNSQNILFFIVIIGLSTKPHSHINTCLPSSLFDTLKRNQQLVPAKTLVVFK